MANFTDDKIQTVWAIAQTVDGADKNVWLKDASDAWIYKEHYGKETDYGWKADHILSVAKGGTDHTDNLRAFHWKNNRSKADDFPDYTSAITSSENNNIEKVEGISINKETNAKLKLLYPDKNYIK